LLNLHEHDDFRCSVAVRLHRGAANSGHSTRLYAIVARHTSNCLLFLPFTSALKPLNWRLTCILTSWDGILEAIMNARIWQRAVTTGAFLLLMLATGKRSVAQETPQDQPPQQSQEKPILSEDRIGKTNGPKTDGQRMEAQDLKPADGKRHGLPLETYGVAPGTKFLVSLEDDLGSKGTPERARFKVKTLEPLEAGSGIYLPSGAEIEGHVSHVESAGATGRGRIWLTFDDIQTKFGRLPIVAEVVSVPGEHSVKMKAGQEGLIEGRSSSQQDAAQAAAAGAAMGALKGVKDKDKKEAAEGAAMAALTAYLIESGRGHELELPKGVKLELELERALYLVKE
jgi:hypothetical protein